jgi:hypothetical protein
LAERAVDALDAEVRPEQGPGVEFIAHLGQANLEIARVGIVVCERRIRGMPRKARARRHSGRTSSAPHRSFVGCTGEAMGFLVTPRRGR